MNKTTPGTWKNAKYLGSEVRPNKYVLERKGDIEIQERGVNGEIIGATMTFPMVSNGIMMVSTGGRVYLTYPIFETSDGRVINGALPGAAEG